MGDPTTQKTQANDVGRQLKAIMYLRNEFQFRNFVVGESINLVNLLRSYVKSENLMEKFILILSKSCVSQQAQILKEFKEIVAAFPVVQELKVMEEKMAKEYDFYKGMNDELVETGIRSGWY